MKRVVKLIVALFFVVTALGYLQYQTPVNNTSSKSAAELLGKPEYKAISYGGYRAKTRDIQPTLTEIKEDILLLHAMGFRFLRTYNVHLPFAENVLKAISELKAERKGFEMYVMLGAWINCQGAWTPSPNHEVEDFEVNTKEIGEAVRLAQSYADIVKVLAVGNEAMVHWAQSYFVRPAVILKWVNYLQDLKAKGDLDSGLWITSSDNFAAWGGGDAIYHQPDLERLIKAVDYISMHTYPFHETHYQSHYWHQDPQEVTELSEVEQVEMAMQRAADYAKNEYYKVKNYMESLGVQKPIHIGETGWATTSDGFYGPEGSNAADQFKQAKYFKATLDWTAELGVSCFFFEAFDEKWKDQGNPIGSENHFGLFTVDGNGKYALWDYIDKGVFDGFGRAGSPVEKTFQGNLNQLLEEVKSPPMAE